MNFMSVHLYVCLLVHSYVHMSIFVLSSVNLYTCWYLHTLVGTVRGSNLCLHLHLIESASSHLLTTWVVPGIMSQNTGL